MSFAWPHLLWLLLLPPALLAWEIAHRRRAAALTRPKILRAEAGLRSLQLTAPGTPAPTRNVTPRIWLCLGLMLVLTALARPQWGRIEEPVFDQSREILLAIDLSRSMLTPDVKPSRLDRAKLLIQSLLEKLAGERVGLVVFAGTAFLQSPLSADYEILREFLPALDPEFLPQGGSNYGALLDASVQAFSATAAADRFLVILSDGEATDTEWKNKVAELKAKNVRVLSLGVGTPGGAMIPDGAGGLVKDERGAVVMSRLESATLQELAQATGGVYRDASAWVDLAALVNETIEAGRKGQFVEKNTVRLVERFQWPLAFGLWFLFVSFCYEFPVRPRVRDLKLTGKPAVAEAMAGKPEPGKLKTAAAVALLVFVSGLLFPVSGFAAAAAAQGSPAPVNDAAALGKIVGRLSGVAAPSGRDWAELGRETVTWGSKLQSAQQPVPEGPVRDALAAVELGRKLDPATADWKKLREELEALLKKSDEQQKDDQQQQDQQDQKDQNQENKDQQKQDQQQKSDQQQKQDKSGEPQDQQNPEQNPEQGNEQKPENAEQKPQGESAFGDMKDKQEPPQPPPSEENTQQVGGAPEQKPEDKAQADPALALPLQKLDQLRNQDSPAQLFQMMEGEKKPAKKTGKDW